MIIGILIAVNLNNANEARKEKADIDNLLKQVQSELKTNIQNIDQIYLYYGQKDSLIYDYLKEIIPSQQIDDRLVGLHISTTLNYNAMEVESGAYEALLKKAEFLPDRYLPLFEDLKSLYSQSKEGVEATLELLSKSIDKSIDYLGTTQAWYADLFYRNTFSKEMKKFMLTDVRFINKVSDYVNLASQNFIPSTLNFKTEAVAVHRQIDDLLGTVSQSSSQSSFSYDIKDFENWLGYYRDPTDSDTIRVIERDGLLRMQWQGNDFEMYPINQRDFQISQPIFFKMDYKSDSTVSRFRGHHPNNRFVYEKVN